jgi:HAD superfamily hydrolase (TIGR01509 family)
MKWIQQFDLILFDFDGLLVDTEPLHYKAYQNTCQSLGFTLPWDFSEYCQRAHTSSDKFREDLYKTLPDLKEPWDSFYNKKREAIEKLLETEHPELMPGAEELLRKIQEKSIPCCVVTHSPDRLVNLIRAKQPLLNTIPLWITRSDYTHPKPHPECYQQAINRYAPKGQVIGFEDSPRGLKALSGTSAKAVLINPIAYPIVQEIGALQFDSFESLPEELF